MSHPGYFVNKGEYVRIWEKGSYEAGDGNEHKLLPRPDVKMVGRDAIAGVWIFTSLDFFC